MKKIKIKKTTPKRKRKDSSLAIYNGLPTQEEIDAVIRRHRRIVESGRSMLTDALSNGDFFIDCRLRVPHGDWRDWFESNFKGKISFRSVQVYVRLAKHRQFLEARFDLNAQTSAHDQVDFERVISIKEADQAIRDMRKEEKLQHTVAGQRKAIDIETTVSESTSTNGDAERATRVGADVETVLAQQDQQTPDQIEDPDEPQNPRQDIAKKLSLSASCLRTAQGFWHEALTIAEVHDIPLDEVRLELNEHFPDQPELALCFTQYGR